MHEFRENFRSQIHTLITDVNVFVPVNVTRPIFVIIRKKRTQRDAVPQLRVSRKSVK